MGILWPLGQWTMQTGICFKSDLSIISNLHSTVSYIGSIGHGMHGKSSNKNQFV